MSISRVFVVAALLALGSGPATAADDGVTDLVIQVYKTPTCGCCGKWVDHLRRSGFTVEVEDVSSTRVYQDEAGMPRELRSCHTAIADGYFIEGHVPADVIEMFFAERPDGMRGIAVPGMPMGSPGMEAPNPEVYDIVAVDAEGNLSRYATRRGRTPEEAAQN